MDVIAFLFMFLIVGVMLKTIIMFEGIIHMQDEEAKKHVKRN